MSETAAETGELPDVELPALEEPETSADSEPGQDRPAGEILVEADDLDALAEEAEANGDGQAAESYRAQARDLRDQADWDHGQHEPTTPTARPAPREDHVTLPKSELGTAGSGKGAAKSRTGKNPLKLLKPPGGKVTGNGGSGSRFSLIGNLTVNAPLASVRAVGGARTVTVGGVVVPPGGGASRITGRRPRGK